MLLNLSVKNFALIDDLDIDFNAGLTALTGETGSGKSILLESLSLLFGKRSDAEYIRYGTDKAIVIGTFKLTPYQQKELSLPETITLQREIDASGRHSIKLNQETITLAKLKQISSLIGMIHDQNDTFALMDKTSYIDFIDQMDNDKAHKLREEYLLLRSLYQEAYRKYQDALNRKKESIERIDFLSYQVKELEALNLKKHEKEDLKDRVDKLKNFDKIKQSLQSTYEILEGEFFNLDLLYEAYKSMDKIRELDPSYEEITKGLEDNYYTLEEHKKSVRQLLKHLDFDDDLFNQYQERLFELSKYETKYQKTIDELVDYLVQIKDELEMSKDYEGYLKRTLDEMNKAYQKAFDKGLELSELRQKLALKMQDELTKSLKSLDLEKAQFEVTFTKTNPGVELKEDGIDDVEFMISLNEGEPLKPLSKVASGGEKARFMFSLKSLFAKLKKLSLLVFDEIDIGISGKTASKVASEMKQLSNSMQLLVITHLPQVAAKADYHYSIYKEKVGSRMETHIQKLDTEKRILAIATMLSDDSISSYAIEQAKALLKK